METPNIRQEWLAVLSTAKREDLEHFWRDLDAGHAFRNLRNPESGLTMIRGRADGSGRPFNLGEATISRCVVATEDSGDNSEIMGVGYVLGRDRRHAELTARFDALFQDSAKGVAARDSVLPVLQEKRRKAADTASRKTDATRVEFFTMVRGE
ncbi:MAG: phosphonate C-P lyase system protein PhnG [Proteobacteria bacterium]|jgi:alpha-D-ribose 1-methylphosphonate 5-triphosphate synthase subunit PhnG|nr:phosphonate C-P lyase system protein PhnG [Pseudomonadota bacterium]